MTSKPIFGTLILVACLGTTFARDLNKEAAVLAADKAWAAAIAKCDVPALEQLFADDFTMVGSDGRLKNKQQEIDNLRPSPDMETFYFRTEDVTARVYGDAAVVTGRAVWKISYKGKEIDNNRRYTMTLIRDKGHWRIVAQQIAVNIPGFVTSNPK